MFLGYLQALFVYPVPLSFLCYGFPVCLWGLEQPHSYCVEIQLGIQHFGCVMF